MNDNATAIDVRSKMLGVLLRDARLRRALDMPTTLRRRA